VGVEVVVELSVPAELDGVDATGDVDSGPDGGGPEYEAPLEAGALGVGAEGPTDVLCGGGMTMAVVEAGGGCANVVVEAGGGGADVPGTDGMGSPGFPVLQSVTVTVTVTAGAAKHAVVMGVSACRRALRNCTHTPRP
jgi:hypothetical protein